jgi:hypothetical protein
VISARVVTVYTTHTNIVENIPKVFSFPWDTFLEFQAKYFLEQFVCVRMCLCPVLHQILGKLNNAVFYDMTSLSSI